MSLGGDVALSQQTLLIFINPLTQPKIWYSLVSKDTKIFWGASNAKNQNICGKKIYTMNPCRPIGLHVAVKEGKTLGAGSLEELASWGEFDQMIPLTKK